MELVQDVSGLMRTSRQRYGDVAPATERWHVVAGNWFAVPYYQRLIGHWLRAGLPVALGLDPGGNVTFAQLAEALLATSRAGAGNTANGAGAASDQQGQAPA